MSYEEESDLDILIGKIIKRIALNQEQHADKIAFLMDDRTYVFECKAECCSNTWIESVDGIEEVIGHKVVSVKPRYLGENEEQSKEDDWSGYIKLYCIDIITSKGTCTIDFRNNSNGYYGGSLSLVNDSETKVNGNLGGWNPFDLKGKTDE